MKTTMKKLASFAFAFMLLCSISVAALADSPPDLDNSVLSSSQVDIEGTSSIEPLPLVVEIIPASSETFVSQEDPTPSGQSEISEDAREQDNQAEEAPNRRNSNTPYFVGAVIAVMILIGVALYCRFNGRK